MRPLWLVLRSDAQALPTDAEIDAFGCANAGQYVLKMLAEDATRKEYEEMLLSRRVGWGGKPTQPLHRCVEHTLSILTQSIEAG